MSDLIATWARIMDKIPGMSGVVNSSINECVTYKKLDKYSSYVTYINDGMKDTNALVPLSKISEKLHYINISLQKMISATVDRYEADLLIESMDPNGWNPVFDNDNYSETFDPNGKWSAGRTTVRYRAIRKPNGTPWTRIDVKVTSRSNPNQRFYKTLQANI